MDLNGPCHLLILKPALNKHILGKHPQLLLKAKDVASIYSMKEEIKPQSFLI